jgi:hypothetical protein
MRIEPAALLLGEFRHSFLSALGPPLLHQLRQPLPALFADTAAPLLLCGCRLGPGLRPLFAALGADPAPTSAVIALISRSLSFFKSATILSISN